MLVLHLSRACMKCMETVQEHVKEMLGLRHGTGAVPGTPVPQGADAGKLEASIQNLHKCDAALHVMCRTAAVVAVEMHSRLQICSK